MNVERYAACTCEGAGGNPAGVVICEALPDAADMQRTAAEVGYSETVFAAPEGDGWRVRYFAPEIEIPFCGHATIALGVALAKHRGSERFDLRINGGAITVEGRAGEDPAAAFESVPASHEDLEAHYLQACMDLFGFSKGHLDESIPPALINAGSPHVLIALRHRATLAAMSYDLERGREVMAHESLATIMLVHRESPDLFHARNPFASGGVYEDPATGSAAAAFAGYLRSLGEQPGMRIVVRQGEDMGMPTRLLATVGSVRQVQQIGAAMELVMRLGGERVSCAL
ncbi:PhzF family phenazine biosynthesis protein [Rhizobium sp. BK529]|uniref:PhzF family phenazine biosynthesis protein n=1 Tax=Rhizobium sp. BK529 TaxID=2586983 RepID=UPI001616699A|nr:PhzF family phenazine biosynthesis protein [Rhizobium sp. BK529]MBB3594902.1 PhzF family phenazine biosynthesis protein [Rhizobium sp. BK529]